MNKSCSELTLSPIKYSLLCALERIHTIASDCGLSLAYSTHTEKLLSAVSASAEVWISACNRATFVSKAVVIPHHEVYLFSRLCIPVRISE